MACYSCLFDDCICTVLFDSTEAHIRERSPNSSALPFIPGKELEQNLQGCARLSNISLLLRI